MPLVPGLAYDIDILTISTAKNLPMFHNGIGADLKKKLASFWTSA